MTHGDLVKIAERWLIRYRKCGAVITELVTFSIETPDAIGFRDGSSTWVECKASRLIWVNENGKPRMQVGPKGNIWSNQEEFRFDVKNYEAEQMVLVSALRRLQGR